MNTLQLYALLNKKVKGLTSGIQSASVNGTTITFIMNDGSTQTMTFPTVADGKSLEYNWNGTKLGVRIEGASDFEYVELKGDDGISPTAKVEKVDKTTTITITDKNGTTTANVLDGSSYPTSDTYPTDTGTVGDIVFNSNPQAGGYIGWVYTALGWFGFGEISNISADVPENAVLTADGQVFTLADGSIFAYADD